jgi:hypothetical protein
MTQTIAHKDWSDARILKKNQTEGNAMKRREFLKAVGVSLAASSAVAAPAIAQSMPELKWRCTTSWPKSLDIPFSASETISKYVAEVTDNKFQIQTFAAGEIAKEALLDGCRGGRAAWPTAGGCGAERRSSLSRDKNERGNSRKQTTRHRQNPPLTRTGRPPSSRTLGDRGHHD